MMAPNKIVTAPAASLTPNAFMGRNPLVKKPTGPSVRTGHSKNRQTAKSPLPAKPPDKTLGSGTQMDMLRRFGGYSKADGCYHRGSLPAAFPTPVAPPLKVVKPHNGRSGNAVFPDSLRRIGRGWKED